MCERVVPVLARMLKLGIVVTLKIYHSQRTQRTAGWQGKPDCPRKAGADLRHAGGEGEHRQYGFHCISVGKHGAEKPVGIGRLKQR